MRGNMTVRDNSDVQALIDGRLYDQRIEALIEHLLSDNWSDPDLETLFNEVISEFVSPCKVDMCNPDLSSIPVEYFVSVRKSHAWPQGGFPTMHDAKFACSICFPSDDDEDTYSTDLMPGRTVHQAMMLALVQYARERSLEIYNQTTLRLS